VNRDYPWQRQEPETTEEATDEERVAAERIGCSVRELRALAEPEIAAYREARKGGRR
jgi:hypothetical protein